MTPFFQILQDGNDITGRVPEGNISLTITDGVGAQSDTVDYEISNEDGVVTAPRTGVEIEVIGGYRERAPRRFGRFVVDEVTARGYPEILSVNAQSVGAKTAAKHTRSESFKKDSVPTYGELIRMLARRNGLSVAIDPAIAAKALEYEAQTEENDMAFLSRLGDRIGFSLTIKDRNLIVSRRGYGVSTSGLLLPTILIEKGVNLQSYSVSRKDRPQYGRVKATWFDRDRAETKEVDAASSKEGPDFVIRTPFKSEKEALDAARARAEDLRRGAGSAEFVIVGDEQARAEAFVEVVGVLDLADGLWRATTVTHAFSGGYVTTVNCELPGEGGDEG